MSFLYNLTTKTKRFPIIQKKKENKDWTLIKEKEIAAINQGKWQYAPVYWPFRIYKKIVNKCLFYCLIPITDREKYHRGRIVIVIITDFTERSFVLN